MSNWKNLKSGLQLSGADIGDIRSLDEIAKDALDNAPDLSAGLLYPPLQVEQLLSDVSELLDRCWNCRMVASELEIAVVAQFLKQEVDDLAFELDSSLPNDISAPTAGLSLERVFKERGESFNDAEFALNQSAPLDKLAAGLSFDAQAEKLLANGLMKQEANRNTRFLTKLEKAKEVSEKLRSRSKEDGSAHNYVQRRERLITFFKKDIVEAFLKAKHVVIGAKLIYGIENLALPDPDQTNFFHEFMHWSREMWRRLGLIFDEEARFELTIPLTSAFKIGTPEIVASGVYQSIVKGAQDPATISFSLPPALFAGMENPRIIGIGLSAADSLETSKLLPHRKFSIDLQLQVWTDGLRPNCTLEMFAI